MSGENIYNLLGAEQAQQNTVAPQKGSSASPYTGSYRVHRKEPPKPTYSTFYEKGKEYDGTNTRFYKQRDAVIGKSVADSVHPANYLKKGEGVRAVVPPIHKEKVYTKPPLEHNHPGEGAFGGPVTEGDAGNDGALPNSTRGDAVGNTANGEEGAGNADSMKELGRSGGYTGFPSYEDNNGIMGVSKSRKNFIASNIVEMSNMVPKNRKDQPQLATDRKDFGQVPAYLGRVKQEVHAEKAFVQALEDQKVQRHKQVYDQYVYRLSAEEQARLVATLKTKLQQSASTLASMPFSLDTVSAGKKKSELQRTIQDIETALGKLDKEAIFVYRDDPVNGQWTKSAALEEAKKYVASTTPA